LPLSTAAVPVAEQRGSVYPKEATLMLMILVIALLILWALGAFAFKIAGGLIHLLLVIAVVVLVYRLVTGRKAV
jgi:Family of unknown function (DUF5670)